MTDIIWPTSLPDYVLPDNYGEQPRWSKASFPSDVGPSIDRPRGTLRMSEVSCSTVMSLAQVETFETFVFEDIAQATLPFLITHPRRDIQVTAKIVGDPPYRLAEIGPDNWSVSFQLLVIG